MEEEGKQTNQPTHKETKKPPQQHHHQPTNKNPHHIPACGCLLLLPVKYFIMIVAESTVACAASF